VVRRPTMPLPFFLGALFGKAAVGAIAKGIAAKSAGAGAKGLVGHHAHHVLAQKVAGKIAGKAADSSVDAAFSRKRKKEEEKR
jgi:hypothetical protein